MLEPPANRQSSAHGASCTSPLTAKTGNIVASELTASRARDATRVPALLTQIQVTSSVGGGGQCIRQGSGLRNHRSAQPWTKGRAW